VLFETIAGVAAAVDAEYDGTDPAATLLSAELFSAHSSRGAGLLADGPWSSPYLDSGAALQAARWQARGIPCVSLTCAYPVLDEHFHDPGGYEAYYRQAARDLRSLGFRIIAKTGATFRSSPLAPGPYYDSLTAEQYFTRRREHAIRFATLVRPDVLTISAEPDTEAAVVGQNVGSPAGFAALVNHIAAGVKNSAGSPVGMQVTAGVGTWTSRATDYIDALAALGYLDLIDLHVYPVVNDCFANLITLADYCRNRHAMRCGIGEAWLFKTFPSELVTGVAGAEALFSRNVFTFWRPLDIGFLATLVKIARWKRMAFVSAFSSQYFHASLSWDDAATLTSEQRANRAIVAAAAAIGAGTFTEVGEAYAAMVGGIYP
jgi:hypothetical protein